jgi:hypothetical protein
MGREGGAMERYEEASGRSEGGRLEGVLAAIDAVNATDPGLIAVAGVATPLALAEGRAADRWVLHLRGGDPQVTPDALRIAARGHHLRRWETPRESYPEGRDGYLAWRTHLYEVHAGHLQELMLVGGYGEAEVGSMRRMLRKERIKSNPDVQSYEDSVALAFLELQFPPFAAKTPRDAMIRALSRTWKKMSEGGRKAALSIPYPPELIPLLLEATQ